MEITFSRKGHIHFRIVQIRSQFTPIPHQLMILPSSLWASVSHLLTEEVRETIVSNVPLSCKESVIQFEGFVVFEIL